MNIGVIVEKRYLLRQMPGAMTSALRTRGANVDTLCPQGGRFDPETGNFISEEGERFDLNRYDVLVSRNRNGLGLAMLSYGEATGILTINSSAAIQQVRNKARMAIALSRAGVACVPTILAENVSALARLPEEWFPLMLKPTYGSNCHDLRLIRQRAELAGVRWGEDPLLAQQYMPNNGADLRIYVCGRKAFGVRKPSPFNGDPTASPQSVSLDPGMVELALRCGDVFGLDIYGVDVTEASDGLAVIEVNDFPNFTSVPGAADEIANYVLARFDEEIGLSGASAFPPATTATHSTHASTSSPMIADINTRLAKMGARIDLMLLDRGFPGPGKPMASA